MENHPAHRWLILATGLLFQATTFGIAFYSFTFFVKPWMGEFGASRGDIMLYFTISQFLMGFAAPFAGRAVDVVSVRLFVIGGLVLTGTGLVIMSFGSGIIQVGAAYVLLVVPGTLFAGPLAATALAARWFADRQGLAIGLSTTGTSIGGVFMPPIVVLLMTELGWRMASQILGVSLVLLLVPIVWLIVRDRPEEPAPHGDAVPLTSQSAAEWTSDRILTSWAFWIPILAFLPVITVSGMVQQNFAPMMSDFGHSDGLAARLVALTAATMIGGKIFFGAMADRLDHRILFAIAAGSMAGSIGCLTLQPEGLWLFIVVGWFGIAMGGFLPILGAMYASRFGAAAMGRVSGMAGPFAMVSAIGPWLGGVIRDESGTYIVAMAVGALLILPAFLVILKLPQRVHFPPKKPMPV